MTKLSLLIIQSKQFLTDRDWWQHHNPKNDSMNLVVEAAELGEHFIKDLEHIDEIRNCIADELSDTLFATLIFAEVCKINILNELNKLTKYPDPNNLTYEQINYFVIHNKLMCDVNHTNIRDAIISLMVTCSKTADMFLWHSQEESYRIAFSKKHILSNLTVKLIAHLVVISNFIALDLPLAYKRKMLHNGKKYPKFASREEYVKIKEEFRRLKQGTNK